jgi:hypothetical protein
LTGSALAFADDDNRARGVVYAMLAYGTEQRLGKPAVPAAPDDQKVSVCCCIEQYLRGIAFP